RSDGAEQGIRPRFPRPTRRARVPRARAEEGVHELAERLGERTLLSPTRAVSGPSTIHCANLSSPRKRGPIDPATVNRLKASRVPRAALFRRGSPALTWVPAFAPTTSRMAV